MEITKKNKKTTNRRVKASNYRERTFQVYKTANQNRLDNFYHSHEHVLTGGEKNENKIK